MHDQCRFARTVAAAKEGRISFEIGPDAAVRPRRLDKPRAGENGMMLRVEEGTYDEAGRWVMRRVWNGDQTDYGLNFTAAPVLLRVKLGTYR